MAWAGTEEAQEQHKKLIKSFLGNGREVFYAYEHVAEFWCFPKFHGFQFWAKGMSFGKNAQLNLHCRSARTDIIVALVWHPP